MQIPHGAKILSVAEMQTLERAADAGGHSFAAMMDRAGEAVAAAIDEDFVHAVAGVLVLAGPGNNGGDGLVCARYFGSARVYLWQRSTQPEQDHEGHLAALIEKGVEIVHADADPDFVILKKWVGECGVIVDALLGTGANRPVGGQLGDLLDTVRDGLANGPYHDYLYGEPPLVVAVDCPSGLNCDTGALDAHAIAADITVTFGHAKHGHFKFPGASAVGKLVVADIGIDPALSDDFATFVLDRAWVAAQLPARPAVSHKGSYGKVMAAVGSINYPGAAYLSCAAAARVGAGLVTAAVAQPVWAPLAARFSEATFLLLPSDMGVIAEGGAKLLREKLTGYDALLVGCGLTQEDPAQHFVRALFGGSQAKIRPAGPFAIGGGSALTSDPAHPLPATVIDADGLNCLARLQNWPDLLPAACVLTPHPAEMARLCGMDIADVLADPWGLAQKMAQVWGAVVLLKGPYTVIAQPGGVVAVLPVATSALATAGTGDVLAGCVAGLLAQGLAPFPAACAGAWLHGQAGLLCDAEVGPAGTLAGDLLGRLPGARNNTIAQSPNLPISYVERLED